MEIIDNNTVVVTSSEELKNILENNNSYTYIYFGNDITLTSGIKISGTKNNITINGTYNNNRYKFTDMKSLSTANVIAVSNKLTLNVTVKNMDVTGYNYYGIIYVPESNDYKNIIIEYNNITYIGPQISFNPNGLTRFIDCNITIQDNYASGNEVAECNKIEIGGNTTILHKSTANSSFWFRNSEPSLTILKNAIVNFTSISRELIYGVYDLKLTLNQNSTFNVTTKNGLSYGNYGTGTTLIDSKATLNISQTEKNGNYSTWYSSGVITLNELSNLSIINNYTNISTLNYNINFTTSTSGLILNNPGYVILYNESANVISTSYEIPFEFNFTRINLFSKAIQIDSEISLSTLPTYAWYKDNLVATITGKFNSTKTTIEKSNFTEEELLNLPSLSNFNISTNKALSVADSILHINPITDKSLNITGKTTNPSSVLIQYNDINATVKTDENNLFKYDYETELEIGTVITITSKENNSLIYHTKKVTIIYSGDLTIDTYPEKIEFILSRINNNNILLSKNEDIIIKITDSRIDSTDWKLYASINHDLEDDDKTLISSIVYLDDNGNINILSNEKTLVYQGEKNEGVTKETTIVFKKDENILAQIINYIEINKIYSAVIIWSLEE